MDLCINHDFCTELLNVRDAGANGLSANASPLLSLTDAVEKGLEEPDEQ
jgi:hypothetical protein